MVVTLPPLFKITAHEFSQGEGVEQAKGHILLLATTDLEQATKGVRDSTDHTGRGEHRDTHYHKDTKGKKGRKGKNIYN